MGFFCSILSHSALVWWLAKTDVHPAQISTINHTTPIQLVELPQQSSEPQTVSQATENSLAAKPFEAVPSERNSVNLRPRPNFETPLRADPLPPTTPNLPSELTSRPIESPAAQDSSIQDPQDLDAPPPETTASPPPFISDDALVPVEAPPPTQDSRQTEPIAPENSSPEAISEPPEQSTDNLPAIAIPEQPTPATYRATIAISTVPTLATETTVDQLPYPSETERTFEADPRTTTCSPNPEAVRRLGEPVAIQIQVDASGNVTPLSVVDPTEAPASPAAVPLTESPAYEQLAACLLQEWGFQPALAADGTPVDSNDLVATVQITSAP